MFFDALGIRWQYEREGFELPSGRRYLPDFYLPACGTWIEVKGDEARIDRGLLIEAACHLPQPTYKECGERGPVVMLLGPIPRPMERGDYGWIGFNPPEPGFVDIWHWGFGTFHKNQRPWALKPWDKTPLLIPTIDPYEWNDAMPAYQRARSARFEHGESG